MDENIITSDKILKTMICLPTCIRTVDTIYWNGKHWLVPEWREDHTKRMRCPVRIIELDSLQPQPGVGEHHFQVQKTIPSDVFDGNHRTHQHTISYTILMYGFISRNR